MGAKRAEQPQVRVAFFLPDLGMGGAERVFLTLSSALARRGYKVELILARKTGDLLAEVDPEVELIDLDAYRSGEPLWRFGMRTVVSLARRLRRYPPDALFSTLTGANLSAIAARALSRRSFRLLIREAAPLANVKFRSRLWLMRLLYPLADRVVVLTEYMSEQICAELRLRADRLAVIANPVDGAKLRQLAQDPRLVKRAQEFRPYAVCVGRLSEPKDQATAIRSIARAVRSRPLSLVLVGDGTLKNELQLLAKKLNIENRIHFVGTQMNPYPWIAQADVFLLSSRWEGYPNALVEAKYLGVPIVATAYDRSICELLDGVANARIVGVGQEDELASAALELMDAPFEKVENGMIGYDSVVDSYERLASESIG